MSTTITPSRTGFLGRIGWQARQSSIATPAVSSTIPEASTPQNIDVSPVLSEDAKLKAELKKLRQRCEDYKTQSEMNQEIMQECVTASQNDVERLTADNQRLKKRYDHLLTTSKADIDTLKEQLASASTTSHALAAENKSLKVRCEELTTQSTADKDMLRLSSADLASKTAKVESLHTRLQHFNNSTPNNSVAKDAKIAAQKQIITSLQCKFADLQENYVRLTAMGCTLPPTSSSNELDLERRIDTLEFEKAQLQDKLDDRVADTKNRMLDYSTELNDMADQLRHAEADALAYSSELKIRNSQLLTLKAEFDAISSELYSARRASKRLTREFLRQSNPRDVLVEQLAALQSTSLEREALISKFKEQYEVLARAVKREQGEKEELSKRVEEAWEENRGDRKRFEGVLRRRDGRIRELERRERWRERLMGRVDSAVGGGGGGGSRNGRSRSKSRARRKDGGR